MQRSSQSAGSGFWGVDELRWLCPQCRRNYLRCTRQHRCLCRKLPQKQRSTRMILSLSLARSLSYFVLVLFSQKSEWRNSRACRLRNSRVQMQRRAPKDQPSSTDAWSFRREKKNNNGATQEAKEEGKRGEKKNGENKNGSCGSSASFFCPQQRFRNQENGTKKRRAERKNERHDDGAKASARSSRLRGRRRDEDDGGDDVRTFSRLPFLCDVGNFFLKKNSNHFINLF